MVFGAVLAIAAEAAWHFWSQRASVETELEGGVFSQLWLPAREELFYLRNLQPLLEKTRKLSASNPVAGIKTELGNLGIALERANATWLSRRRYAFSLISLRTAQRAARKALESETQRRLTLAALALARYSLIHGGPPSSLELLVPEFLAAVPIDPMVGETLRYRLNPDRTFTLYSVDRDGVWPAAVREPHDKVSFRGLAQA